jgi:hypothetical protein
MINLSQRPSSSIPARPRLRVAVQILAIATAIVIDAQSPAVAQRRPAGRVPGRLLAAAAEGRAVRVIVGVRGGFRAEGRMSAQEVTDQRAAIRTRLQTVIDRLTAHGAVRARRFRMVPFFVADVDSRVLDELDRDSDVTSIEEDKLAAPALAQGDLLVGAPGAWVAGVSGAGWTLAILDTGVDKTHPFLSGKVVSEACYSNGGGAGSGISLCPDGTTASTAVDSGRNCGLSDCDHGTHVAGIAAGAGASFSGIARDATIVPIQVFTQFNSSPACGSAPSCILSFTSDEIRGLERVLALRNTFNIAAVNMSLGAGRYFDQASCDADNVALKAAIDNLRSVGIATVAASGNDGRSDSMTAPGCISSAVSVGSTTKADEISSFTNTAPFLSLLAPGSSITSSVPGGGFATKSGTSMATAFVAGAWAVLKQQKPAASVTRILSTLQGTGRPLTDPLSGLAFRRIQVDAAFNSLITTRFAVETPASGATVMQPFPISGWAVDPDAGTGTGVDAVHVYAYPQSGAPVFVGAAALGTARPDIGAIFGARFANSGYTLTAQGLAPGAYRLVVYVHSSASSRFDVARVIDVTIAARVSRPVVMIDAPVDGAIVAPSFFIGGWTIDAASLSGSGIDAVHIYAYPNPGSGAAPIFLGVADNGGARPDVGAIFGSQFNNSGYGLISGALTPGAYRIVVYARSTFSGSFSAQARDITVRAAGNPAMSVDLPASGATLTSPFVVGGWAIDLDAVAGSGVDTVHVWAYSVSGGAPTFVGVASYGGARMDIGNLFGPRFVNSGYDLTASSLAPGAYDLVVYSHSTVTGTFSAARVVRVTVQ